MGFIIRFTMEFTMEFTREFIMEFIMGRSKVNPIKSDISAVRSQKSEVR